MLRVTDMINFQRFIMWLLCCLVVAPVLADRAADRREANVLVSASLTTFDEFVADPNMDWFRNHIKDAEAVLIVPRLLKAGFIFGGAGGNGVALARDKTTGRWSDPAFYSVGLVTAGLQVGGEMAQVAMLLMTEKGMNALLSTKVQLGVDASIAAGPVGTGTQVATFDILQFTRAKGIYGGLTLEGAMVVPRDDFNAAFYRRDVSPVGILVRHEASNPLGRPLRDSVSRLASQGSRMRRR